MEKKKEYLGDGVYAEFDGYHIVLKANDPKFPTDIIYLDEHVLRALVSFAERLKEENSG